MQTLRHAIEVSLLFRGFVAACVIALVLATTPSLAEGGATIEGTVVTDGGQPAVGHKVIVKDLESGTEFTSGVTDSAGRYSVEVPVGGRYQIQQIQMPDGTLAPVQEVPPVRVQFAGTTQLNVGLMPIEVTGGLGALAITGIVLGSLVVAAGIVALAQDDEDPASP